MININTRHKKLIRSTSRQMNKMMEYMALNPSFANGEYKGAHGFKKSEKQWLELKNLLKELGPDKEVEQWKQSWRDLKRKLRNSNADATKTSQTTGNSECVPTPNEIILDFIGRDCSTEIGPEESQIGETYVKEVPHPAAAMGSADPTPSTSDSEAEPLRHRRRPRRRRQQESLPTYVVQLHKKESHRENNKILNRVCDLLAENNSLMREIKTAMERQGDLLNKLLSKE